MLQINPSVKLNAGTSRKKRGLINALGSISRAIPGNLDSQEAERYDKIINQLTIEPRKIKTVVQSQISIVESLMLQFIGSISLLAHNQKTTKNKILGIDFIKYKRIESVKTRNILMMETITS